MTKAVAVVPAGGSGSRMGIRQPKQYLTVGGAPILVLTLRALARCASLHGLIVAAPADASRPPATCSGASACRGCSR
jgi:4-diphosphocytidyl-2-methyl-D-erithritol synthase